LCIQRIINQTELDFYLLTTIQRACADIPFETEEQLRERGTARTPDVLLSTPIAIKVATNGTNDDDDNWRVVCWIDSKVRTVISITTPPVAPFINSGANAPHFSFNTYLLIYFFVSDNNKHCKALFGDAHTHKDSVLPQAESYIHRFGPGMLLYWFGHAPMLPDANGDLVICGWNLPETFLLPTGELSTNPTY
jgi:uncharacterized membrane protein YqaE (UPF0057 family)